MLRISFLCVIVAAGILYSTEGLASGTPAAGAVPAAPPGISLSAPDKPEAPHPIVADLSDGSKVEIDADSSVWVLQPDASRTVAPDGTMTLSDGTPFVVKEGKLVRD